MNENLKVLRKELRLNQESFGEQINLSRSHIASLENGSRNLTDRIISDICREFNVNEEWLRNAQGEIFVESDSSILAELSRKHNLDSLDISIFESYLGLTPEHRKVMKDFIRSIALSTGPGEIAITADESPEEDPIEKELNAYRLELEAEQKGEISSALEDIKKAAN